MTLSLLQSLILKDLTISEPNIVDRDLSTLRSLYKQEQALVADKDLTDSLVNLALPTSITVL